MHPTLRAVAVMTMLAVVALDGRQATPATGVVEGRVVDAHTGQPVRGVIVTASPPAAEGAARDVAFLTGLDGRFVLRGLRAGSIGLTPSKTGYAYADEHTIALAAGGHIQRVQLTITPEARISGRVVDQSGDPVDNVTVRAVPLGMPWGSSGGRGMTDDTGAFVIGGLTTGRYVVGVDGSSAALRALPMAFYSSASTLEAASAVEAVADSERHGVDLVVHVTAELQELGGRFNSVSREGTGTIAGIVRDATGRPVPRASVAFRRSSDANGAFISFADEQGRFEFVNVDTGRAVLTATRGSGFVSVDEAGVALDLAAGQRLTDVALTVATSAVVGGTLFDEFGDPIAGSVWLQPTGPLPATGRRTPTNARGQFRISGVRPGEYRLVAADSVNPPARDLRSFDDSGRERRVALVPVFAPGVTAAPLGSVITVARGRETPGVDAVIRALPVSTIDVTIDAGGRTISNEQLQYVRLDSVVLPQPFESYGPTSELVGVNRRGDARFIVEAATAGRYLLVASGAADGSASKLWSRVEVTTDGMTPLPITIRLEPGAHLSGRFVFDGTSPQPSYTQGKLRSFFPASATVSWVVYDTDERRFDQRNIQPGRYVIEDGADASQPSNWMLKSVTTGGQDVLDVPIDIPAAADFAGVVFTFTDRVTELAGTVTNAQGRFQPDIAVVVFPADARYWHAGSRRVRMMRANRSGEYSFRGLPAGEYRVIAIADLTDWAARLPKLFPISSGVSLSEGDRKKLDLKLRD